MNPDTHEKLIGWSVVGGISASFMIWSLFTFFMVGDKGPPPWDFSIVQDIPGKSEYITQSPHEFPYARHPVEQVPEKQHVMGRTRQYGVKEEAGE